MTEGTFLAWLAFGYALLAFVAILVFGH